MKLHILGTSGPFPESNGATSGYLLEADETLIQLDLGSGVLSRLTAQGLLRPHPFLCRGCIRSAKCSRMHGKVLPVFFRDLNI